MTQFEWGDVRLSVLDAGSLWLDGGAMFGVVPKPLWERERAPDERNRIELAMNLLLVEDGRRNWLVDTGAGEKWDAKSADIYRLETRSATALLAPTGLTPGQIDCVVLTHLHFDHAGGGVRYDDSEQLVPSFPNAEYFVQRGELETARWNNEPIRASYLAENFEPLAAEPGRLRLCEGDEALSEHVRLSVAPGHTPWMQMVRIVSGRGTVCFLADLIPMMSHVRYAWIMGYDLEPLRTLASKKRYLPQACAEGWRLMFEHDPQTTFATLVDERGKPSARAWHPEESA